jgi:ELWxxDGT repeat protein/cysteine-rich repeat protein
MMDAISRRILPTCLAGLFATLSLSPTHAQAPAFLVKDINHRPVFGSSNPHSFLAIGDTVFFIADVEGENALWHSDGSADGTVRLTSHLAVIDYLVDVNGMLFFVAGDGVVAGLWKSDGTPAGTVRLAEIPPIGGDFILLDYASLFAPVGDVLYFAAGNPTIGFELWRSDGTAQGTVPLKRLDPVDQGAPLPILRVLDDAVLFAAWDEATGYELWRSDGTPTGTALLSDIAPGAESSYPEPMAVVGGRLLFSAFEPGLGNQLWSTDGTPGGTGHISNADPWRGFAGYYVAIGDTVYFAAGAVAGGASYLRLWRSDGTAQGTRLVDAARIIDGITPYSLFNADGTLFFAGAHPDNGVELWTSDGTAAGTRLVHDIGPGAEGSSPVPLRSRNGVLYFTTAANQLWRSDGSAAGTFQLARLAPESISVAFDPQLTPLGHVLFFLTLESIGVESVTLWTTDGTVTGTERVASAAGLGYASSALAAGETMLFFAGAGGSTGVEPWKSDGTAAGTTLVANLVAETQTLGSGPFALTSLNDTVLFFADDGERGVELWRSDGTADGTVLVEDIVPGPVSSAFGSLRRLGNAAYFPVRTAEGGLELWRSDGTEAGTTRIAAIGAPAEYYGSQLIDAGGILFVAVDRTDGSALWRSDGTETGTFVVKNSPGVAFAQLTAFGPDLVFATGSELWKSDGTVAGTVRVVQVTAPVGYTSTISHMAALDGALLFAVHTYAPTGNEAATVLWRSDGSSDGTAPVAPVSDFIWPNSFVPATGQLFFVGYGAASGRHLWRSDGTAAGTSELVPLRSISGGLFPRFFWTAAAFDDGIWYGTLEGLFRTDGTVAGSDAIRRGLSVLSQARVSDSLLFSGCVTSGPGCALWESDGTSAGTRVLAEVGVFSNGFTLAGPLVFFSAEASQSGQELWAVPLASVGRCGNGALDAGEACDAAGETAMCDLDCTASSCGDAVTNRAAAEQCDDGNAVDGDCCTTACASAPTGQSCADNNFCNGNETCDGAGGCRDGTAPECSDAEPDTVDTCENFVGCVHICPGDCDRNGAVNISELVTIVALALTSGPPSSCQLAADANGDGRIGVDEIIRAVKRALRGCPVS